MPEDRPRPNFNRYPMLWLATAFAAGILATKVIEIDQTVLLAAGAVVAIASLIIRRYSFAAILTLAAFAAAGSALATIEATSIAPDRLRVLYDNGTIRSGDAVEVEGVLTGRPEPSIDGGFLNLRSEKITYRGKEIQVSGNVRLFLPVKDSETAANLKFDVRLGALAHSFGHNLVAVYGWTLDKLIMLWHDVAAFIHHARQTS